jgi:hypothetical protein
MEESFGLGYVGSPCPERATYISPGRNPGLMYKSGNRPEDMIFKAKIKLRTKWNSPSKMNLNE